MCDGKTGGRFPMLAAALQWLALVSLAAGVKCAVGNSDAHLKYLNFLVSHEGIQLAPFYDLLSLALHDSAAFDKKEWPAQTPLAWPILGVQHFSDINHGLLLEAGVSLNLTEGTAQRLLESLRSRAVREAQALTADIEAENAQIARTHPELSASMAGYSCCLRALLHTIRDDQIDSLCTTQRGLSRTNPCLSDLSAFNPIHTPAH